MRWPASDRAIVTDIAGTTRDLLRETVSLDGVELTLVDTAGLRESADEHRSRRHASRARANWRAPTSCWPWSTIAIQNRAGSWRKNWSPSTRCCGCTTRPTWTCRPRLGSTPRPASTCGCRRGPAPGWARCVTRLRGLAGGERRRWFQRAPAPPGGARPGSGTSGSGRCPAFGGECRTGGRRIAPGPARAGRDHRTPGCRHAARAHFFRVLHRKVNADNGKLLTKRPKFHVLKIMFNLKRARLPMARLNQFPLSLRWAIALALGLGLAACSKSPARRPLRRQPPRRPTRPPTRPRNRRRSKPPPWPR